MVIKPSILPECPFAKRVNVEGGEIRLEKRGTSTKFSASKVVRAKIRPLRYFWLYAVYDLVLETAERKQFEVFNLTKSGKENLLNVLKTHNAELAINTEAEKLGVVIWGLVRVDKRMNFLQVNTRTGFIAAIVVILIIAAVFYTQLQKFP